MVADETPEDRLEAALERIAKIVDSTNFAPNGEAPPTPAATEVAVRLDRIIDTLRDALDK